MKDHLCSFCLSMILLASWTMGFQPLIAQEKSSSGAKTVAAIHGVTISEEELNRAAAPELEKLELQRLQSEASFIRSRQQILESTLKRLVEDRLLDDEAARQGIKKSDLLAKEVDQKVKDPTPEEVNSFYEANKSRIPAPKEQVTAQIQQYLKQQKYNKVREEFIDRLKKENQVTLALEPLRTKVEVEGQPSKGSAQAPVTIVEFSDFQCPYCKNFTDTLYRVLRDFSSDVRLVFRQFPLSEIHPMAEKAGEASLCAQEQGKFWEFHDLMFKDQAKLKVEDLKAKSAELGLDTSAFNACLDSGKHAQRIRQDIRDAAVAGASGTPAVFINGRFFGGARPYDELAAIVKEELQRKAANSSKP